MKGVEAKIFVKEGAMPKFFKPRTVPHILRPTVGYLGFKIDKDGLHPTLDKVKAITEAHGQPLPICLN